MTSIRCLHIELFI